LLPVNPSIPTRLSYDLLTIDTLSRGALVIDPVVKWPVAIQGHAHLPAQLPVGIFDTATAFGKLRMIAGLCGDVRKEQGTAEPLGDRKSTRLNYSHVSIS